MHTKIHRQFVALAAAALFTASPVWAQKISMEAATATSVVGLLPQSMAPIWAKGGINVELAMGQTLTKSLLKLTDGSLDTSVVPPPAYADLKAGRGPYSKMGGKGAEAAGKVTALWGFSASSLHAIVWADSGITDWSKIKGKRVYIGPPAGAANEQITAFVKLGSGYAEGADYSGIKAPWGVAPQGFQDGQFDVLVLSAATGSQTVTEIALSRPIRILSIPGDAHAPEELGVVKSVVPKGTYKGQVNNDVDITTWQTVMMMMAKKELSDDIAYRLTKSYVESRKELAAGNAMLKELVNDSPFVGVIAPLHPGAVKYYKEAGLSIPAKLMPK